MPHEYCGADTMDKAEKTVSSDKKKLKISDEAMAKYRRDAKDIREGKLKSPSTEYQFIWDKETGQRLLFKGRIDPPTET